MQEDIKFFVGLDVHMDSIAVAAAEAGREPARLIGNLSHDVPGLLKVLARYGEAVGVDALFQRRVVELALRFQDLFERAMLTLRG